MSGEEQYAGGSDLAYGYRYGSVEYLMCFFRVDESKASTTYRVELQEMDADRDFARDVGTRLIEVAVGSEIPHEMRFGHDEGEHLLYDWLRHLGQPEKLLPKGERALQYLDDQVQDAVDLAGKFVSNIVADTNKSGEDADFTSLTRALIEYEQHGDALLTEVRRWLRPSP